MYIYIYIYIHIHMYIHIRRTRGLSEAFEREPRERLMPTT